MLAVNGYFCCFFPPISHQTKKYESIQRNTDNESPLSVFRELVFKWSLQRENKGVIVAFGRIYLHLCVSNAQPKYRSSRPLKALPWRASALDCFQKPLEIQAFSMVVI